MASFGPSRLLLSAPASKHYIPLLRCFCTPQGAAAAASHGGGERKGWLVLEGTLGPTGKVVAAVGEAQLKVLRAAREEVQLLHTYRRPNGKPWWLSKTQGEQRDCVP